MAIQLSIEGNIAAGKSTFLKKLETEVSFYCTPEPVESWQKTGLLEAFYQDPKRWGYTFQMSACLSRLMTHMEPPPNKTVHFLERSVFSDRYCFALHCREEGLINEMEWTCYKTWHEWVCQHFTLPLRGIVYLRTSPQVCYDRLRKRSRTEESSVPLDYLTQLHQRHEDWLVHKKPNVEIAPCLNNVPVLIVDCDQDFESDHEYCQTIISQVKEFIARISAM